MSDELATLLFLVFLALAWLYEDERFPWQK